MFILLFLIGTLFVCSNGSSAAPRMSDETMYHQIEHFLEMTTNGADAQTEAVRTSILESQLYSTLHAQFGAKK
jgi:hypothetical protein